MKKQTMTYEAPELHLISVCVEKGFAASSGIEPEPTAVSWRTRSLFTMTTNSDASIGN